MRVWTVLSMIALVCVVGWLLTGSNPPRGPLAKQARSSTTPATRPAPPPADMTPAAASVKPVRSKPLTPSAPSTTAVDAPSGEDPAPATSGYVTLFEHASHDANYPGRQWSMPLGLTVAGAAFENDQASAIHVPEGLQVTVFDDARGVGHRIVLGPGDHNLAPYGMNDRASMVRVTRKGDAVDLPRGPAYAVMVYQNTASGDSGDVWPLSLGVAEPRRLFTPARGHFADNAASAVWVPDGYEVILFDEPDGHGLALVLEPGFHELAPRGFNDRASSIRVERLAD